MTRCRVGLYANNSFDFRTLSRERPPLPRKLNISRGADLSTGSLCRCSLCDYLSEYDTILVVVCRRARLSMAPAFLRVRETTNR